MTLLVVLGLAILPAIGLWIASGLLVAVWLAILFTATQTKPAVRAVAFAAAALSFVAIGFHLRLLLWIGVLTMTGRIRAVTDLCTSPNLDRPFTAGIKGPQPSTEAPLAKLEGSS